MQAIHTAVSCRATPQNLHKLKTTKLPAATLACQHPTWAEAKRSRGGWGFLPGVEGLPFTRFRDNRGLWDLKDMLGSGYSTYMLPTERGHYSGYSDIKIYLFLSYSRPCVSKRLKSLVMHDCVSPLGRWTLMMISSKLSSQIILTCMSYCVLAALKSWWKG